MFSDELLRQILASQKMRYVPIKYQAVVIRCVEETLEKHDYVVEHKPRRSDRTNVLES